MKANAFPLVKNLGSAQISWPRSAHCQEYNYRCPGLAKHDTEKKYSVLAKSVQITEVPIMRGFTVFCIYNFIFIDS